MKLKISKSGYFIIFFFLETGSFIFIQNIIKGFTGISQVLLYNHCLRERENFDFMIIISTLNLKIRPLIKISFPIKNNKNTIAPN